MWEQNVTEIFVFLKKRIKEEEEEEGGRRRDLYVALYPEIALEEANALGVTTPMVIFQPQMWL